MYKINHKTILTMLIISLIAASLHVFAALPYDSSITLDFSTAVKVSTLELGVTNTHFAWDNGEPEAVNRAFELLNGTGVFESTYHGLGS